MRSTAEAVHMSHELHRLVVALGYDPGRVRAMRARGRHRIGVRVEWADTGKLVRFHSDKELRRRGKDFEFLRAWEAAGA